jgi:hypothetical protein
MTTTATKRSAAAGFALPGFVALPFATGTDDEQSRWHGGFCYFLGGDVPTDLPVPTVGWTVSGRERVFSAESVSRVFAASRNPRVWRFREKT